MLIAYEISGRALVASIAPGVTAEQAAKAMNLVAGTWREITDAEAAELQKPTLEQASKAKIAEIDAGYAAVLAWLRAGYPPDEAQTWTMQAEQARQLATDPQAEALFVRYLASTKGVSVEEMTGRILVNAQNWEPIAAILTAQRQLMQEAAEAAQSVEEVEAIKVSYSA